MFRFGQKDDSDDEVYILNINSAEKARIDWTVAQGSNCKDLHENSTYFDLAWTHIMVTVCGFTMRIYKNGALGVTDTSA